MTTPVTPTSQTSEMRVQSHVFTSFDEKVCHVICNGIQEDFNVYLEKGLDTNYSLKKDVFMEGLIFPEGSPLIFIIIRCCTITSAPWDLWAMARLLLDKKVDLKKQVKNPEGGGGKSVYWIMRVKMQA